MRDMWPVVFFISVCVCVPDYSSKHTVYTGISHARPHPVFPVPAWAVLAGKEDTENTICDVNTKLWDCLGSDRDWGLVSLIDKGGERRLDSVPRLLTRTELVYVSTHKNNSIIPTDYRLSGVFWYGRRCYTHSQEDQLHVLIQGDLDKTGDIFDEAIAAIEKGKGEERVYSVMLEIASRITSGDILELGTDEDTSELLHKVVENENTKKVDDDPIRMLVTADSDSSWLINHSVMISSFHQFVFVPLHHQVAGCHYKYQARDNNLPQITCKHLNNHI